LFGASPYQVEDLYNKSAAPQHARILCSTTFCPANTKQIKVVDFGPGGGGLITSVRHTVAPVLLISTLSHVLCKVSDFLLVKTYEATDLN